MSDIKIRQVDNGYILDMKVDDDTFWSTCVFSCDVNGFIDLLYTITDFYNINNSRYNKERVTIINEVGDKYVPGENEEIVENEYCTYYTVEKKNK